MSSSQSFLFALVAAALSPPSTLSPLTSLSPALASQAVSVPTGSEPTLDGVMGAEEWADAATLGRSGAATLLAKRAGDTLFVGLRGAGSGITTLGLLPEGASRLRVLHASASLGTAEYERDGAAWKLVRPFTWAAKAPPGTPEADAARAAFREQEGWLGTLVSMGAGDSEMAIDWKGGGPVGKAGGLRCAVGHLGGSPVRFPAGSNDGLFSLGLQMGTPPSSLASDPATWLELRAGEPGEPVANVQAADADAPAESAQAAATAEAAGTTDSAAPPQLAGFPCVTAGSTWIYCADPKEAQTLVTDVLDAAREFERYFGRAPEPGAVVAVSGSSLPAGFDARLRAAGAHWVLPWISVASAPEADDSLRAQIESQLRAQLEPLGMSDAQIESHLDEVMARLAGSAAGGLGLLRHELGHVWFISAFWGPEATRPVSGGATGGGAQHYAGPAADWLDETAAILLESEAATARRRSAFAEWRAAHPEGMRPLDELFTMPHPVDVSALGLTPEQLSGGGSVIVRVQSTAESVPAELGGDACPFYEQCRFVADYLLATGGERVFASLAASAARGEDLAQWLATDGEGLGLPATTEALQAAWLEWLGPAPGALSGRTR